MWEDYEEYLSALKQRVSGGVYGTNPLRVTVALSSCSTEMPTPGTQAPPPSVQAEGAKDYQKDRLRLVVTDWCATLMEGSAVYEDLGKAPGASGVPWGTHVGLLAEAVRQGDFTVAATTPGESAAGPSSSTLTVKAIGAVPLQWVFTVQSVRSEDKRKRVIAALGTQLVQHHVQAVAATQAEHYARVQAEEALARARAAGAVGDVLSGGHGAVTPAELRKPQSLLNPSQRSGTKRPRGVKIS